MSPYRPRDEASKSHRVDTLSFHVIRDRQTLRQALEFVNDAIGPFVRRLRERPGKDIWLMGGGEIIASFLDARAIDEFVMSVAPVFIGEGIPLLARRHRHVPLDLYSIDRFKDGVVQLHYRVHKQAL